MLVGWNHPKRLEPRKWKDQRKSQSRRAEERKTSEGRLELTSRISMEQVKGVQSLKGSKTGAILFPVLLGSWKVSSSAVLLNLELSKHDSVSW